MHAMAQAELVRPVEPSPSTSWSRALIAGAAICMLLAFGLFVGGQPAQFAFSGLTYLPLIGLGLLLQLSQYTAARILSWAWFWGTMAAFAVLSLALIYLSFAPPGTPPTAETFQRLLGPMVVMLAILVVGAILAAT